MATVIPERWKKGVLGSQLTSIKVGGEIAYFSRPTTIEELQEDLILAQEADIKTRIIGGGSDILFADAGMDGLVIQPALTLCTVLSSDEVSMKKYDKIEPYNAAPRYARGEGEKYLALEGKVVSEGAPTYVELGAGVAWGQAVMWSLNQGLTGLHWFARIPCNVGGAVFNNIHGEKHLLSEVIVGVNCVSRDGKGETRFYPVNESEFGYDYSRFHTSTEVITSVILRLFAAPTEQIAAAKTQYLDWTKTKNTIQPIAANCGSVFQNLEPSEIPAGETSGAAGYYVEFSGQLGRQYGGMQVYPTHGNFITNLGTGTQADFIALVQQVRETVKEKYGVTLHPEAECITENGERFVW